MRGWMRRAKPFAVITVSLLLLIAAFRRQTTSPSQDSSSSQNDDGLNANESALDGPEKQFHHLKLRKLPNFEADVADIELANMVSYNLSLFNYDEDYENLTDAVFLRESNPKDVVVSKVARSLFKYGSILAFVIVHDDEDAMGKMTSTHSAWLNRVEHGVFFTSEPIRDRYLPFHALYKDFDDSPKARWYKTKYAFHYAYRNISEEFDWYMKVDLGGVVLHENLRAYLDQFDPSMPVYVGMMLKGWKGLRYHNPAAYALSRAAAKIFADELYHNKSICSFNSDEGIAMARCLAHKGIYAIEASTDGTPNGGFDVLDSSHLSHLDTAKRHKLVLLTNMTAKEIALTELLLYRNRLAAYKIVQK